ncbi:MAG: signal peptide peptidase SppA [Methanoregulaceae archaeon]
MADLTIYEQPYQPPQKSPRRWIFLILIACVALVGLFIAMMYLTYSDNIGIAVIRIDGTIATGNQYDSDVSGSEIVGGELRAAADDPMVEAIVLRVNSPGGTPAGAQEIIEDLDYAKTKKPVVISMGDMATSAAYWISSHGDRIYANPDTITAGVGTIWTFSDISSWMGREGYNTTIIKSGSMKDMGTDSRPLTEEETAYAQNLVNDSFETFIGDVLLQRNVSRNEIENARVVRGAEARRIGLVDELGNLNDAIEGAKSLAKVRSSSLAVLS